jgi:protein-L-isoaspartate(D-aspartate) O-methyltransferase
LQAYSGGRQFFDGLCQCRRRVGCASYTDVAMMMSRSHDDRIYCMTNFAAARQAMVDCQVRPSDVTRYTIIEAMLWAPRELFVPKARRDVAYAGAEVALAPGRVLLEPRTFAKMIETANIGSGDLVLDLMSGTGYSTAVIARMAEAVIAIEPDPELADWAQALLSDLEVDNAVSTQGDPSAGDSGHGPYDVIFINGAVETLPDALVAQLKEGGRLVSLFRQGGVGQCCVLTRAGANVSQRYVFDADAPLLAGFEQTTEFTF